MAKEKYRPATSDEEDGIELAQIANEEIAAKRAPSGADLNLIGYTGIPNGELLQGEDAKTGLTFGICVIKQEGRFRATRHGGVKVTPTGGIEFTL